MMRWTWTHVAVPPPACGLFYSALDCTLSPKCRPDIKRRLDAWPVRRGGTAKKELEKDTALILVNTADWAEYWWIESIQEHRLFRGPPVAPRRFDSD